MRVITWNCNVNFKKKFELLQSLSPDIAIIQECEKLEVNPDRFDKFVFNLTNTQVAVISVKGMVCDFCARGIEKTFQKDKLVKKIDVDLAQGKVLLAYDIDIQIVFEDIQNKILANGINAIKMQILVI